MSHYQIDEVTNRAQCLSALVVRNIVEYANVNSPSHQLFMNALQKAGLDSSNPQKMLDDIDNWMIKEHLDLYQSVDEENLLSEPMGKWTPDMTNKLRWRIESLGVLLWSLHILDDIPPYDQWFDPEEVVINSGILVPITNYAVNASLRTVLEIEEERDAAYHWVFRDCLTKANYSSSLEKRVLKAVIKRGGYNKQRLRPQPGKNDFNGFGKAYTKLNVDERSTINTIVNGRLLALSWLADKLPEWDVQMTGFFAYVLDEDGTNWNQGISRKH